VTNRQTKAASCAKELLPESGRVCPIPMFSFSAGFWQNAVYWTKRM